MLPHHRARISNIVFDAAHQHPVAPGKGERQPVIGPDAFGHRAHGGAAALGTGASGGAVCTNALPAT